MPAHAASTARFAAIVLLVGLVVTACGQGGRQGAGADTGPVATASAAASPTADPVASASANASSPAAPSAAAPLPDSTPDPLDNDLRQLEQLLDGIGSSLSGASAGSE
jgi:hypothetical protein